MWGMTLTNEKCMHDETDSITNFGESPLQSVSEFLPSRILSKNSVIYIQKQQIYPYSGPEGSKRLRLPDYKTVGI